LGIIRLEFVIQPRVIGKKTQHSNRAGGQMMVNYIYSDTETSSYLKAYRQDKETNEWVEIDQTIFNN
ncbi:MAG: hypothetical protein AAB526_03420, partial [Patescibacteria group bacterium]